MSQPGLYLADAKPTTRFTSFAAPNRLTRQRLLPVKFSNIGVALQRHTFVSPWLEKYNKNFQLCFTKDTSQDNDASTSLWKKYQNLARDLTTRLKSFGLAGVLAYGLFNTVYYASTFLFVWLHVMPSPGGLGVRAAAERFVKVMATVWAGSQVTKLLRAAGALMMAPIVDRLLLLLQEKMGYKSRGDAFKFVLLFCLGIAALLFASVVMLWA